MNKRDKLPLFIGIGLPLLLIIYIVLTITLPSLFNKPQYNFIYAKGCGYDYDIGVTNGKVLMTPKYNNENYPTYGPMSCLYVYDVTKDSTQPISIEQANAYHLDASSKSPDGYSVDNATNDENAGFFPFFWSGSYDNGVYLTGHGVSRRVESDQYDFQFIAWITQ